MVIDVGHTAQKTNRGLYESLLNDHRNSERSRGTYNVECFRGPPKPRSCAIERFQAYGA
jgi:hypothetical protein